MGEMDEEAALKAAAKLDLADRVSHQLWKARKSAYEFVLLQLSSTDGASQHKQFARLSPSMISDANPAAQDAACDAIIKLLQVCDSSVVTDVASTLSKNVVAKTFKGRPALVNKSTEILVLLLEHECAEDVMRHVVAGYKDKVPKVAQAALGMTLTALQQFGPKVLLPSLFASSLVPVFDGRDVTSRKTAQDIVVELARWQGPDAARASILPKLRDAQKKDIEAMFQDLPPGRPVPERRTRSAQASMDAGGGAPQEEAPAESKPPARAVQRNFGDDDVEVDIMAQIPKSMWTDLEDTKWSIRKAALTSFKTAASVNRAVPGDLHEIAAILKKVIQKDSNAACVAEACACVAALSKCMRKGFSNFAKSTFFALCLDKSKDKNSAVRARALEAVTAMHAYCTKLADVVEQISVSLGSPSPQVKQATLTWLADAVEMEGAPEVKPLHKPILPLCAGLSVDAVPAVRDSAISAIAAFARVAGKLAAIEHHISALDDRRKKQVEDAVTGTSQSSSGAPSPPRPGSRPGTSAGGRPGTPPVTGARPPLGGASRPGTAGAKRLVTTRTNKLNTSASSSAPPSAPTLQPTNLSKDDAKEFITEKFGEPILKGIENSVWKNRLEALTTIQESISSLNLKADGAKVCLTLCYIPGWKDSNFQVLAKVCNICNEVVRDMAQFAKGDAHTVITGVVDKLSDIKIQPHAWELLSTLAETTSLNFVMSELFKPASSHRSPKVYQASITWMARSMAEFGKASVDSKAAVGYAIDMLGHKDAAVREAGTEFTAVLHEHMGARLDGMLAADVKSAMMDKVRARWGAGPAVTGDKQRTEKSKTAAAAKAASAVSTNGSVSARTTSSSAPPARVNYMPMPSAGGERSSDAMHDMEPRTDISSQITDTLLKQMSDNNWKERKEAVETVESILQRAGGRIEASFGGLLPALKLRIPDTNRNLAAQVIRLAASVCSATGHRFSSAGRTIVLPILKACSDSKPAVQAAVAQFATEYVMQCGWTPLGDPVSEAMGPKCTSGGRVVLLDCFKSLVAGSHPPQDDQEAAVVLSAAAAGLQDKGLEPRRLAGELIGHLQGAGITAIPPGASSLLSADKITALAEKMGTAEPPPIATQSIRTGRLQTTSSTRTAARSASASGRPGTAGAPSRGSSADPRPATSAGGRGAAGKSALMTQSSTSSLPCASGDDGEAMVHLVDEIEKEDRRVPQRSFKFEQRLGEAKEVHALMSPAISPSLASLMFSADFKKHCLACDKLVASLDTYIVEMASVLDLLLRWSVLRFVEEKLQSVVKVQAFLTLLLERLALRSYQATDNEANVFLPCLCDKAGHNQERVRAGFAQLLSLFRAIYNPHRYVVFLLEGMDSKNIKSRAECCDALAETLREWGVDVLYHGPRSKRTSGAIKRLAGCTAERDAKLRKSALGALMVVFEQEGARFWQLLGEDLPSTQADLIKERAKFVEMEMVKQGAASGTTLPTKAPAREASKSGASSLKTGMSSPNRELGAAPHYEEPRAMPGVPSHLQTGPYPHAEPSDPHIAPAVGAHAHHAHVIATGAPHGVYQEPSTNALHTVPFVPGHPSGSGGVDGTPPPATARASYYTSYNAALQQLHHDQSGACVEAIKTIYWTLSSMGDGPQASAPVEEEAKVLIRSSINDVVMQLMSRSLVLSNLATTLALAQGTNPLRPLRYLMNCMLKIWEIRLSDLLEVPPMTLVTREVLAQLTNHRQIHATFAADGSALLRLLNMIMLKILESSNLNSIFAALLNCLLQIPDIVTTRGPTQVHCYLALTVKCLTKITKTRLSEEPVDLPTLVLDLHRYFSTLGASEVRRLSNNNDKPLRMVKTMLHTLCKIYGYKVADTIAELPDLQNLPAQPMVAMYADINLKSLAEIGMIAPRDGATDDGTAAPVAAVPPPARSDSFSAVSPPQLPAGGLSSPAQAQSHTMPPAAAPETAPLGDKHGSSSAEPQALPLMSHSSHSASGLDVDAAASTVAAGAPAEAPVSATGNSMMSAERTASSLSSHAIALVEDVSDSQAAAAAPTTLHRASRSHISEPGSVAGSAASGSIKRTASNASAGASGVAVSTPASAAAAAVATGAAAAVNGASVMSGVSGGISAPSASRAGSTALSNAASGGISAQGDAPVRSQVNSSMSGASVPGTAAAETTAAAPVPAAGAAGVAHSGSRSGSLANSGSVPLAQSNSGMSGGANSGQLSSRSAHSDSQKSGGLDSDEDEDDPGSHPDHFLSRIARRVESGGGEQPQPLQSSNTVNTSPGRHTGIGPTMPEDLREKVTETFNKIGMHNTTMMGLETLYNLLEENPSFPVEDLLCRTSEPFRQYISKGLQKVHKKRVKMRRAGHGRPHQPLPTVPEVNSNSRSASGTNDFVSPESERHRSVA